MIKKFSEFIEEGMWGSALKRSNTGEERREDKDNTQYIDLGLPSGTLWADRNIGATEPEEYGDLYAWGETVPKEEYTWDTYKWGEDCDKYNGKDGKTVLDPEDDVVYLKTKGKAHIPTIEQIRELLDNTTSEKQKINGVIGGLYKSNINDNTIFIPFAGMYDDKSNQYMGRNSWFRNWSSSLNSSDDPEFASNFYNNCSNFSHIHTKWNRCAGFSVRGVKDK